MHVGSLDRSCIGYHNRNLVGQLRSNFESGKIVRENTCREENYQRVTLDRHLNLEEKIVSFAKFPSIQVPKKISISDRKLSITNNQEELCELVFTISHDQNGRKGRVATCSHPLLRYVQFTKYRARSKLMPGLHRCHGNRVAGRIPTEIWRRGEAYCTFGCLRSVQGVWNQIANHSWRVSSPSRNMIRRR